MAAEVGFRDHSNTAAATASSSSIIGSRGGGRRRDLSPDSVILTLESNFSLFSSASASISRCSFTSEPPHDRDSVSSDFSNQNNVAGHERGRVSVGRSYSSSGPDLNLSHSNKLTVFHHSGNNAHYELDCKKVEKASNKVQKQEDNNNVRRNDDDSSDGVLALESARNSFSQALRECQERRKSRSDILTKKLERRRPASLDLNNAIPNALSSSPRFGVMKKSSISSRKSSNFPSPGTPVYHNTVNRGWSSERVPSQTAGAAATTTINNSRRQAVTGLVPYNNHGRTLPSKWEDAERWIFSPVGGDMSRSSYQQQSVRRPKSKSGPLGPPGGSYYSICSPTGQMYGGNSGNNFNGASPFSAGGMICGDGLVARYGGRDVVGLGDRAAVPTIARCASVHGCTDLNCQSSGTSSQDEKAETERDTANKDDGTLISRKDVATQISPEDSCPSSPRRRSSFSQSTPSILPAIDVRSSNSSKPDVRDVQVDERVTVTRWSKKHKTRIPPPKPIDDVDDWKMEAVEACPWEPSSTKTIARATREEAKIIAWENLQKAKAEAAIRKLEMKLEKKRSSSMDRILNKLKSAQKKAQEMRSSVTTSKPEQLPKTPSFKSLSFRKPRQVGSLSGCFTCPAF